MSRALRLSLSRPGSGRSAGAARIWRRLCYATHALLYRIGIPGVVALGIATAGAAMWISTIEPLEAELEATQGRIRSLSRADVRPDHQADAARALEAYRALLPHADELTVELQKLRDLAAASGIRLGRSDYSKASIVSRYFAFALVSMTLSASADQFARYIGALMVQMPAVAIESVTLRRSGTLDPSFEIQLRLRLYARVSE